ncbi:DUF1501 domain-containing protein [Mesobacterium pallidum]|uniref:DUF1501 domain-containing protein n=1 Tax=Mesobacterium pallidum TaxID=2872037 RepID=UPI001EE26CD5|nr:DUF1501 domain-containing protein [Mesobacterium pallidum]
MSLSRRAFLARSLALGCSAAASPLLTPVTFASAPWDNRLVVIILRGAMDGLGTVLPYGDRDWAGLRPGPAVGSAGGPLDLDGRFAMNAALADLKPLWDAEELGFVHAVSTPYRDKRSHFDGQDLLEAGTTTLDGSRDGWLNRLLQVSGASDPSTAFALGRDNMILLQGRAPHSNWTPEVDLLMTPQALRLAEMVMSADPAFQSALGEALVLAASDGDAVELEMGGNMMDAMKGGGGGHKALASFAAQQLNGAARIAAFSLGGWDTHSRQERDLGNALGRLSETIATLRADLGANWDRTAVLAMTEFGRTVRLNGTAGTDHGTGGAMLFAGGALRGGQVVTDWPGLGEGDLYAGRDLMPTRDVRAHAAWVMRSLFGTSVSDLERVVFPGIEMGAAPAHLL